MSVVLAEYDDLRARGLGHFRAVSEIAERLSVDDATARRVIERAQQVARRPRRERERGRK